MQNYEGNYVGTGLKIGIVIARFNDAIGRELLHGALDTLKRHGVAEGDIAVAWVPGAFELPLVVKEMAQLGRFDAILALGVVIRGATSHYDFVAGNAASGIAAVGRETGVPCLFGVLTTESIEQAWERAGTKAGNAGSHSAHSAIEMATLLRQLRGTKA